MEALHLFLQMLNLVLFNSTFCAVERGPVQQCPKSAVKDIEMDTENGFLCDETRKMHTEKEAMS